MFGIRYISFDSMRHVIHYKKGKIKKEGKGLAFYYYAPSSSIVAVPLGSADLIYGFNLTTADFQTVTVQGQITYRVSDPRKLAELLDFTVDAGGNYLKNDIEKLDQRLINEAQTAAGVFVQGLGMKEAIGSAKAIEGKISEGLSSSRAVRMLGIQHLSVLVLGVSPGPEMARALEARTRESLQKEADEAIYSRRNFAVEQERIIKESELSTEIAVEQKKKQIAEKRMEAEVAQEENRRRLREMKVDADVSVEEKRRGLIATQAENSRVEAQARGAALEAVLKPYRELDWKTLMAISPEGMEPRLNVALAFRELAEKAERIGSLNITPDLLESMIAGKERQAEKPAGKQK